MRSIRQRAPKARFRCHVGRSRPSRRENGRLVTYRHTVTVRTDDLAVLLALRGLVHYCQREGSDKNKAWAGTGEREWRDADHQVTFKFSRPDYRATFMEEVNRLLPSLWSKVSEHDR